MKFSAVESFLHTLYPIKNAEQWDNVGFIFGRRKAEIKGILCCLTVTPEVVKEAVEGGFNLIVAHHPFPFRKTNRVTDDTFEGEMLLDLAAAGINIYSPHTAFDSSLGGINEQTLALLGVIEYNDLTEKLDGPGAGRYGMLPKRVSLGELCGNVKSSFGIEMLKVVGDKEAKVQKVAVACGSGGDFFSRAKAKGVDVFLTGEASFHTCVAAKAYGIKLILTGHHHSERFAVENLANELSEKFPKLNVIASKMDLSPVEFV